MDHDKKKENTNIKKPKSQSTKYIKKENSKTTFKLSKEAKADLDSIFHL